MRFRRPGLQGKWGHVVNSLEKIIPAYEVGSKRIALFTDNRMRIEAAAFVSFRGNLVLDLGSGPGTMARLIERFGASPLLLDVSRRMLSFAPQQTKVQGSFEYLPFRDRSFTGIASGFALRDSLDLLSALGEIRRVLVRDGKFAFCDLGKPDSNAAMIAIALYLRLFAPVIGLLSAGLVGLKFGSLYDTYMLALRNDQLAQTLSKFFRDVKVQTLQMGGAIVVKCAGMR